MSFSEQQIQELLDLLDVGSNEPKDTLEKITLRIKRLVENRNYWYRMTQDAWNQRDAANFTVKRLIEELKEKDELE